jgi:hypothetical protein
MVGMHSLAPLGVSSVFLFFFVQTDGHLSFTILTYLDEHCIIQSSAHFGYA